MILKDVVRFFKVTSAGYEPLPWALYHAGFYNSLAAYKKPIVAWSDGTQAIMTIWSPTAAPLAAPLAAMFVRAATDFTAMIFSLLSKD